MIDDTSKPTPHLAKDEKDQPVSPSTEAPESDTNAIFPEIRSIVDQSGLPAGKRDQLFGKISQVIVQRNFSGPLPHPEILHGYTQLIPDGGERVMGLTERQSAHRIKQENRVILHEIVQTYCGQIMAFIIACLFLYASYTLGMAGHDVLAAVLGGATVVGLAGVFVYGKRKQEQDLEAKRPAGPQNLKKAPRR